MNILGLSCFYHDSAACLLCDGELVAAVQEERFDKVKYSKAFPYNSINFCLQKANITIKDVDYVVFHEKPYLKFYRIILDHLRSYPFSIKNFLRTIPEWLSEKLVIPLILKDELVYQGETLFIKHHLSHAASTFLVSGFKEAAILTADGVGEFATLSYGYGKDNSINILKEINYPDSLGLIYTAVTTFLGFRALSGEGKVMGLSGYGEPVYLNELKKMIDIKDDGSFHLDRRYFGFNKGKRMYSRKFIKLFGEPRQPGEKANKRHCDIAASLQKFIEEIVIDIARYVYKQTGKDKLCLAGGLFLNCVINHKILEETEFREIFIQPVAGDGGGALGAAFYVYNNLLNNKRNYIMKDVYIGPEFSSKQIGIALSKDNIDYTIMSNEDLIKFVAQKIAGNKVIGWFQGRMEYGPRALGNRSILANPCNQEIKELVNSKVKNRESFRPYAPSVIEEKAMECFDLKQKSPFMILAASVKKNKKDVIPGVTHKDGTARIQTVNKKTNSRYWNLIKEFEKITKVPVLLNTSFNLKGEPIVCNPDDAIYCFMCSEMDVLVLGNYVVERK